MKKSDIGLIIGVVLIMVVAAFVSVGKPFEKVSLTGEVGYSTIDYEKYNELLEGEEYFFIAIGRTGCSFCEKYKPVLEEVAEDLELPIHYIDIADLEEDEIEEFSTSNSYLKNNEWGTPTTLILNKDEVIASQQGYVDEDKLEEFIEKYVKLDGEE